MRTSALYCGCNASCCWLLSSFQHFFFKAQVQGEHNILDIVQLSQHNGNIIAAFVLHTNYIKEAEVDIMAIFPPQPCMSLLAHNEFTAS
jgi:hypothetical protein